MVTVLGATFELKRRVIVIGWLASCCVLTLLPLVVEAVVTEAILGGAGAPAPGGAACGHPGQRALQYYSLTHPHNLIL